MSDGALRHAVALNGEGQQSALVAPSVSSPGKKWDAGKRRWDLAPWQQIGAVVDVLGHGAAKYGEGNWQHLERFEDRYFAAIMRHMTAWKSGERIDPDSGLSHLAHAACSVLFLMWREAKGASDAGK